MDGTLVADVVYAFYRGIKLERLYVFSLFLCLCHKTSVDCNKSITQYKSIGVQWHRHKNIKKGPFADWQLLMWLLFNAGNRKWKQNFLKNPPYSVSEVVKSATNRCMYFFVVVCNERFLSVAMFFKMWMPLLALRQFAFTIETYTFVLKRLFSWVMLVGFTC